MRVLRAAFLVGPVLLAGCGGCGKCLEPSGPAVDMVAARAEVARVFAGAPSGVVADGPIVGPSSAREPCAITGAAFDVTLEVGEAFGCDDYRGGDPAEEEADCAHARDGAYPWTGVVTVDGADSYELSGTLEIWSNKEGLWPFGMELILTPSTFPRENVTPVTDGLTLADTRLLGLEWSRRLSETENEPARWEVCAFAFE